MIITIGTTVGLTIQSNASRYLYACILKLRGTLYI